jgi:hypothetical protein
MSFLRNLWERLASLRHLVDPGSDWLAWDCEGRRVFPSRQEMCGDGLLFLHRAGVIEYRAGVIEYRAGSQSAEHSLQSVGGTENNVEAIEHNE